MKTVNNATTGISFYLLHAYAIHAGHGHKKISVEVEFDGNKKTFSATTSNMPAYDNAIDLRSREVDKEYYNALYNIAEHQIENQIGEWIMSFAD